MPTIDDRGGETSLSGLIARNEALENENKTYFNNCVVLARRLKELEASAPPQDGAAEKLLDSINFAGEKVEKLLDRLDACDEAAQRCAQSVGECLAAACASGRRHSDTVRSRPNGRADTLCRRRMRPSGAAVRPGSGSLPGANR